MWAEIILHCSVYYGRSSCSAWTLSWIFSKQPIHGVILFQFSASLNGPKNQRTLTHLEKYPFEIRNQSTHTLSFRALLFLFCFMPLTIVYEGTLDGSDGLWNWRKRHQCLNGITICTSLPILHYPDLLFWIFKCEWIFFYMCKLQTIAMYYSNNVDVLLKLSAFHILFRIFRFIFIPSYIEAIGMWHFASAHEFSSVERIIYICS